MTKKTCCIASCDNESGCSDNGIHFYSFPTEFNLCMLWVQNCGEPEYFEDFAFGGAQPFLNRSVCSEHFNEEDYINAKNKSLGLLPDVVPRLSYKIQNVFIKQEIPDIEFSTSVQATCELQLLTEIKEEKLENEYCDESEANFLLSSTDDSCNDAKMRTNLADNEKRKAERLLSKEFIKKYQKAKRRNNKIGYESDEHREIRLKKEAIRARIRRANETNEETKLRRMKNALRAAFRRKNETPEETANRRMKDMIRAQMRRKAENQVEARIRRYNDAVRAAFRRNNETEEQRNERRRRDSQRAAKRRSMETLEQRQQRLIKDRERASKRRLLKKIFQQINRLDDTLGSVKEELIDDEGAASLPLNMSTIKIAVKWCNESTNIEHLRQVLNFIESNMNKEPPKSEHSLPEIITGIKCGNGSRSIELSPVAEENEASGTSKENILEYLGINTASDSYNQEKISYHFDNTNLLVESRMYNINP